MALLDDAKWQSNIFIGEWTKGGAGDAPVVEPATGEELGRIGRANVDDVALRLEARQRDPTRVGRAAAQCARGGLAQGRGPLPTARRGDLLVDRS
jgi:benzaldehyde dehydrogenase (NAD)